MKRRIAQHATALAVAAGLLLASAGVAVSQIVTGSSEDPAASTSTSTDLTTTGLTTTGLTTTGLTTTGVTSTAVTSTDDETTTDETTGETTTGLATTDETTTGANGKVLICHFTHSKKHPAHTISVSTAAEPSFLARGDHVGACTPADMQPKMTSTATTTTAAPT